MTSMWNKNDTLEETHTHTHTHTERRTDRETHAYTNSTQNAHQVDTPFKDQRREEEEVKEKA